MTIAAPLTAAGGTIDTGANGIVFAFMRLTTANAYGVTMSPGMSPVRTVAVSGSGRFRLATYAAKTGSGVRYGSSVTSGMLASTRRLLVCARVATAGS